MKINADISTEYLEYQLGYPKCSKLTDAEKIRRLNKQFIDADYGMKQADYNRWIKDAKKTYIGTIETESLLMGDLHCYRNNYREELSNEVIGNLSIAQIVRILDSIDLYTIMKLISNDIEITNIAKFYPIATGNCIFSDGSSMYLYAELNTNFNRSWSQRSYIGRRGKWFRDGIKSINGINAYELLYRFLRLPIGVVLSSINEVNTHMESGIPFDDDLCQKLEDIQTDKNTPKILVKNYLKYNK